MYGHIRIWHIRNVFIILFTWLRRLPVPGHAGNVIQRHCVVTGQASMHHLTTTHLNCPVLHGTINPATNTQQKSCMPAHTQNMGTTIHYHTTCLGPASHYHPRSTLNVCVCVCVCACVRACVRAYVHACMHACMRVCVCTICHSTVSCLQYIYLYYICVFRSEFHHVSVYLLKLLSVNSCMVGQSYGLKPFNSAHCMCLYIFCIFL